MEVSGSRRAPRSVDLCGGIIWTSFPSSFRCSPAGCRWSERECCRWTSTTAYRQAGPRGGCKAGEPCTPLSLWGLPVRIKSSGGQAKKMRGAITGTCSMLGTRRWASISTFSGERLEPETTITGYLEAIFGIIFSNTPKSNLGKVLLPGVERHLFVPGSSRKCPCVRRPGSCKGWMRRWDSKTQGQPKSAKSWTCAAGQRRQRSSSSMES